MTIPWTDRGFFNISAGGQSASREASTSGTLDVFGETATFETGVRVTSQPTLDVMGGVRVWRNLAVALGYTRYSTTTGSTLTASIPDPLFFDTPHFDSRVVDGLGHSERATHLSFMWMIPMTDRLDVAVFAGPSFYSLDKDVVTNITIPAASPVIGTVSQTNISESATGGHYGLDFRYRLFEDLGPLAWVGGGLFARYSTATVDTNVVNEGSVKLGGFKFGIGLRLGF